MSIPVANGSSWIICASKPSRLDDVPIPVGFVRVRVKAVSAIRFKRNPLISDAAFKLTFTIGVDDLNVVRIKMFLNPVLDVPNKFDAGSLSKCVYILKRQNNETIIETKLMKH